MHSKVLPCLLLSACVAAAAPVALACCSEAEPRRTLGEARDDNAGHSVAGGFDFNGDGHDDIAIGAIYDDRVGSAAGAVLIVFGGPAADALPDLVLTGDPVADDHFGSAVASPGDWNGDGIDDLAVGARLNDRSASAAGAVFVFLGGAAPASEPALVLTGESRDSWFGQSVSAAGDVDGDGHPDLIVGAPYFDGAGNASGRAYVFFGGPSADAVPDLIFDGEAGNDHFGWAVGGGGDVDGDGFSDLVVGARLADAGPLRSAGQAYLFLGGNDADAVPDRVWGGRQANAWFGEAVAIVGDVNGDGLADVAVGSRFDAGGAGSASLFLGGDPPEATAVAVFVGSVADGQAGSSVAGLGDLNGDGLAEWGTGARFDGNGVVHVFCGAESPASIPTLSLAGLGAGASHGASLAAAGEGDGEPGDEIVAGQPFDGTAAPGAGSAIRWSFACAMMEPLVADFTWSPGEPFVDESVQLSDASTGGPTAWDWDLDGDGLFGDSALPDPTWSWAVEGLVPVSLRVSDGARSDEVTRLVPVEAPGSPPGEVSAPGAPVPLTLGRRPDGTLLLRFESLPEAERHALYAGSFPVTLDHLPLDCDLAVSPSGVGALEASLDLAGSAYLLVTAANPFGEGPSGRSSDGSDRGGLACP